MYGKKYLLRYFTLILTVILMSLSCTCFTFAKTERDYNLFECVLYVREDGRFFASWEHCESPSTYKVCLFKLKKSGKSVSISNVIETEDNELDFTKQIINAGAGSYYISVYSTKGGNKTKVKSEVTDFASADISNAKKILRGAGDTEGVDGEDYISADGAIHAINISIGDTSPETGGMCGLNVKRSRYMNVVSTSYDIPQEQWTPGQHIMVTAVYTPAEGLHFADDIQFLCKKADVKNHSGNAQSQTVIFDYIAKYKLSPVKNITLDDDGILTWDKSEGTSTYNVQVYSMGSKEKSETISKNKMDVSDYLNEYNDLKLIVFAIGNRTQSKYLISSDGTEFSPQ